MNGNGLTAPPQSSYAERCLIASVLHAPESMQDAIDQGVTSRSFADQEHVWTWGVLSKRHDAGKAIEPVAVAEDLGKLAKRYEHHRSSDEILRDTLDFLSEVGSGANAKHYAQLVREHEIRRDADDVGGRLREVAHTANGEFRGELSELTDRLIELRESDFSTTDNIVVRMDEVQPEAVTWLWPQRFALGKLSLISGNPGLGKSFVTLDIAARVSTGSVWPDGTVNKAGGVLIVCCEDGLADTVRPRLDAAGADVSRICCVPEFADFSLANVDKLERMIQQTPDCKTVILDPISAYAGKIDSHNNTEVRALLKPITDLAAKYNVAIIAVSHLRKGFGEAIQLTLGAMGWTAAARSVYTVVKDPDDPTGQTRFLLPAKNNLGKDHGGLSYKLQNIEGGQQAAVAWSNDPVERSVDEVLAASRPKRERDEAAEWLKDFLADGSKPSTEVYDAAQAAGHAKRTIERAKGRVGVRSVKEPDGWVWSIEIQDRQKPLTQISGGLGDVGDLACESPPKSPEATSDLIQDRQERQDRQLYVPGKSGDLESPDAEGFTRVA